MTDRYRTAAAFRQALEVRLEQTAATRGVALNTLRQMLLMERLLARLFVTAAPGSHDPMPDDLAPPHPWLLKGGYAMELRMRPRARTTKDLDFTVTAAGGEVGHDAILDDLIAAAERDVGDHLGFEIRGPGKPLVGPATGGWRFRLVVTLAGKPYGGFHVDVGLDGPVPGRPEVLRCEDHLAFAGIPPGVVLAVPRAVQFSEKLAAYTRPWADRVNTRTKDLVDLLLLIGDGLPADADLLVAIDRAFSEAGRRPPDELPPPPEEWREDFEDLVAETGLAARDLLEASLRLAAYWERVRAARRGGRR